MRPSPPPTARFAATIALAHSGSHFPRLPRPSLDLEGLAPADRQLAVAIHRTALQRWITLRFLLDRYLNKPLATLEPAMRGALLGGAAQLLFMPRLPAYAVVDQTVSLTRQLVRPKAAGMVNAVLRKLAALVLRVAPDEPWAAAPDRLPLETGCVVLAEPCLPDPSDPEDHLSIATSSPPGLLARWRRQFGPEPATAMAVHAVLTPPTVVALEPGGDGAADSPANDWVPHAEPGFIVWTGLQQRLEAFLAADPRRRVQDPGPARAAAACMELPVRSILDYCAGRGTKTRQIAALHPQARIVATDVARQRRRDLEAVGHDLPNVLVSDPLTINKRRFDLVVLDVPCSNSAVLARRPEARYRLSVRSLRELVRLQRQILSQTLPLVNPGGWVLYLTCSLEVEENRRQARWIVARSGGRIDGEQLLVPGGCGTSYHDGSYYALIRLG